MTSLESRIREEYERMNQPLSRFEKGNGYMGNTAEYWVALSQYGHSMAYYETQNDAEQHVINFYTANYFLLTANKKG